MLLQAGDPDRAREAEQHLFAARYERAAEVYSQLVSVEPGWAAGHDLLVRALLRAGRLGEAVRASRLAPKDEPEGQTALGRIHFRLGELQQAETAFRRALTLNPRYPGALHGLAAIYRMVSRFQTAEKYQRLAHEFAPGDPEFLLPWASSLAWPERAEVFQQALSIYDPASPEAAAIRSQIDEAHTIGKRELNHLVSPHGKFELKLFPVTDGPGKPIGVGIKVQLNRGPSFQLLLDSGGTGLLLSPAAVAKAGLECLNLQGIAIYGFGRNGPQRETRYLAAEAKFGNLVLANVPVGIVKSARTQNFDGIAGLDLFASHIVTADFLGGRLLLDPYPQQPIAGAMPDAGRLADGFIRVYRFGHMLVVPTSMNNEPPRLFLIDTGASANFVDAAFARESTRVSEDSRTRVIGLQGQVDRVERASHATLTFAGFRQENPGLIAMDMSQHNEAAGTSISGILGMPALWKLRMTVDYRNGAVKLTQR